MSPKKKSKKASKPLNIPKFVRKELRISCASKSFADMRSGKSKRMNEQYEQMYIFCHGKPPKYPSKIKLLAEGKLNYEDLYEEIEMTATKKTDGATNVKRLQLKQILTRDTGRIYYSGINIRSNDLEKKCRTGNLLIGGRNILDLATKAVRNFTKALAFNNDIWDSTKMEPKESGDSVDDCIEYVRRKMYKENVQPSVKNDESKIDLEMS